MFVLITYDVNTETKEGRTRLRKVGKTCVNYGIRVQNSVLECMVDSVKMLEIKAKLAQIIDKDRDSLRFYYLGDNYDKKVEHIGAKETIRVDVPLIF